MNAYITCASHRSLRVLNASEKRQRKSLKTKINIIRRLWRRRRRQGNVNGTHGVRKQMRERASDSADRLFVGSRIDDAVHILLLLCVWARARGGNSNGFDFHIFNAFSFGDDIRVSAVGRGSDSSTVNTQISVMQVEQNGETMQTAKNINSHTFKHNSHGLRY